MRVTKRGYPFQVAEQFPVSFWPVKASLFSRGDSEHEGTAPVASARETGDGAVHLRVLIDGKVCRLSERTKRRWVSPNAPELAARLSKEFSPRPHDAAFEYREVMRIIGELTESLGDRLTIKFISVNDAYASAAQRETLERLCGADGVRRSELPERPDSYFRSKVDLMTEVPVSEDVDLDLLSIERP